MSVRGDEVQKELLEIEAAAERFAHGDLDQLIAVPDSSPLANLVRALNRMAEQLKHLEDVRRDFVANVSHELKTPLTAIKGFVEMLQDGTATSAEDQAAFLGIIARHVDRMIEIVVDLLTLSRLEGQPDETQIQLHEHSVRGTIQGAVEMCQAAADARKVKLVIEAPAELCCRANRVLLEQAIVNLIDNAVKYSEPGSVVRIEGLDVGSEQQIRVVDHGAGIAPEHLDRIFNRFYRIDKARSRKLGGTGLGLSIVKHIAQVHGGRASVSSEVGKGSTFIIHLPLWTPVERAA